MGERRIYGAENIRRHLQSQKPVYGGYSRTWVHNGEREISRRLRQAARDAERQRDRLDLLHLTITPVGVRVAGVSRRGRAMLVPA